MTKAKDAAALGPSNDSDVDELTSALLNATIEEVGERGYEGARVADIAARVGVTTGAVYTRFSGKDELLLAAFDQESGQLLAALSQSNLPTSDILARLGSDILVADDRKSSALMLESFAAARRSPELSDRLRPRLASERVHLAKLVDEEKSSGAIDSELDSAAIAVFVQAVGIGTQLLNIIGYEMPEADDWDHLLRRLIGSVLTDSSPDTETTTETAPTPTPRPDTSKGQEENGT